MTTFRALLFSALLAVAATASAGDADKFVSAASPAAPAVGRYLVTLSELASLESPETLASRMAAQYGVRIEPYARDGFRGFMIVGTPARARLLSLDPRVARVEEQASLGEPTVTHPVAIIEPPRPLRVQTDAGNGSLTIGTYTYDKSGNITKVAGVTADDFHYDRFSRLTRNRYGDVAWQEYDYDRFGNIMATRTMGQAARAFGVNASNNRMDAPNDPLQDVNAAYDANGNATALQWGIAGVIATFSYDALNVTPDSTVSGVTRKHLYNATDERIASIDSSGFQRWTIRDPNGQVLRRFATSGTSLAWVEDYVYTGSAMLAAFVDTPARLLHYHLDHLGTPRLITGNGGVKISEHRYYPFGEEFTDPAQDGELKKFTGHERDLGNPGSADDLDYMRARYYATASARFLSPDKILGKPARPQSWNRYAYVTNNPLRKFDPLGLYEVDCTNRNEAECNAIRARVRQRLERLLNSRNAEVRAAARAYGTEGDGNEVVIHVGATRHNTPAQTEAPWIVAFQRSIANPTAYGAPYFLRSIDVTFLNLNSITEHNVLHEGGHVSQAQTFFAGMTAAGPNFDLQLASYDGESAAYRLNALAAGEFGAVAYGRNQEHQFRGNMSEQDIRRVIDAILRDPNLGYQVTPQNKGLPWP